jgi:hypothetical protein
MAEQIISPGVFTRENDLSFLPAGVGAIGAAIIGPTVKGPAFVPTVVNSFADYERKFGPLDSNTFVPQTVREYLKNAGTVTVCRVLAGGGYGFGGDTGISPAYLVAGSVGVGNSGVQNGFIVQNYTAGSGIILGAILPSKNAATSPTLISSKIESGSATVLSGSYISTGFNITLSGTNVSTTTLSASLDPSRADYLPKQLGYTPDNSKDGVVTYAGTPGYSYINFQKLQQQAIGAAATNSDGTNGTIVDAQKGYPKLTSHSIVTVVSASGTKTVFSGSVAPTAECYSYASTPMIQSGQLGSCTGTDCSSKTVKDLFKFHTIVHGTSTNLEYKVSIANLREPADIDNEEQYSTFSVIVRKYGDTDKNPIILEQFNNCNLNPDDSGYIARKIGDRYPQYNDTLNKVELLGNYPNISNYVRVEVDAAVEGKSTSPKLSPKGFAAIYDPILTTAVANSICVFPSASYEVSQSLGTSHTYSSKGYLGWRFKEKAQDNTNWMRPLPDSKQSNISGKFNVDEHFGHTSSSLWSGSLSASIDVTGATGPTSNQIKFSVPFQGGSDGIAPWKPIFTGAESTHIGSAYAAKTNLYGFDLSATDKAGYKGYKKALDILSNQDEYDINMLAMPGVIHEYHPLVTNAGIDMCEERGDAFFVMDLNTKDSSINNTVSQVSGLDSNYTAVYYPWVKVLDTAANKPIFVPPSVIVPGAIAASDRIGAEWFAPAGLNRGVLGNVIEAKIRLSQSERDVLYDNKINPIATFPATGVCIWGQKTLQERSTALDRINVRRLLIALKKFIASSSRYLLFEQNTIETRDRFLGIVNPYLESVQQRQGLYAFRVQMDENNNTPDIIDRNQLVGAIYLQPAKTAEFIVLDFNVLPTGATFPS